jgi:hypothetical protein
VRAFALAATVATLVLLPAARASAKTQCAPGNRWCVAVLRPPHKVVLSFAGFGYQGAYRLCVTAPKAKEGCKTFGLRPNGTGANASSVVFARHFPHSRKGTYRVRWLYHDQQVGKTMTFTP